MLKYKAKKGRRLAAHLRLQNDRLKQAVEDEQNKFKQLKEALKRRAVANLATFTSRLPSRRGLDVKSTHNQINITVVVVIKQ